MIGGLILSHNTILVNGKDKNFIWRFWSIRKEWTRCIRRSSYRRRKGENGFLLAFFSIKFLFSNFLFAINAYNLFSVINWSLFVVEYPTCSFDSLQIKEGLNHLVLRWCSSQSSLCCNYFLLSSSPWLRESSGQRGSPVFLWHSSRR